MLEQKIKIYPLSEVNVQRGSNSSLQCYFKPLTYEENTDKYLCFQL